ncbi:MAG: amino acid ABC transporter permease [Clostridia bacterium]|nr:amino acid ABC transporter permease [Clostridia bacterium]
MLEDFNSSENITGDVTLYIYEIQENVFELYLSDETVNTVFGGLLEAKEIIKNTLTVNVDGEEISIATKNTLRTGINDCLSLNNYDSRKPDTAIGIIKAWNTFKYDFHRNFIVNNQWTYITNGLLTTLKITALAVLIGIAIGFIVAVIRCTNQKTGKLSFLNGICRLYISIMRGTPVMVQLLIMYFVILLPIGVEKFPAAVICFGLNSGAYVSEIVRGGIMSIDAGQTEAGRSLGFTYMQTMWYIIIPQAFKAVLPSLANEFITLLKESSVAFYIGVADLTLGGLRIRSITYSNYMPLIAVALIYLILVLGLSKCVSILERRLRKSDNR